MAWKLRKDKIPSAEGGEEMAEDTALADTTVAAPNEVAETPEPDTEPSPFILATADDELLPLNEHNVIAPPPLAFGDEEPSPAAEALIMPPASDWEEAAPEPKFTDTMPAPGPFAPVHAEATSAAGPVFPPSLDREQLASGLVHTESGSDMPQVAPFIVDVPPEEAEEQPTVRTLAVRIGNFAASFELTKEVTLVGRPDSILQSYPDVEIELDDAVSRRHAEIRHQGSIFSVVDLGSTNGTLLNGEKIEPQREYPLSPGDRLHLGDRTEITIE
jgi:hypothetical protein